MKTFERDGFSIRVKVNGGKIFYCLYDITKSLNIGSKGGTSIKEAIERAFKRKISKVRIGNDDFSFVDEEQLEHFLRLYSTSADFNAFIREIPYWHKSQEAKEVIAKESQVVEPQAKSVPSVVEKEIVSTNVMESQVQVFNCDLGQVRVIVENGEPLFCLSDLAHSLEIKNGTDLKTSIDREFDKGGRFNLYPLDTKGGKQNFTFINESELYFVIMRSDKNKAKEFRQWICNEVLPSIRKTDIGIKDSNKYLPQEINSNCIKADVKLFNFEMFDVETLFENSTPYFRLTDIENILGLTKGQSAKWIKEGWFDEDEVKLRISQLGGHPLKYVAESGLYRILNRTNSPKARPFERWVTKEVLPSIRKTGSYQVEQKPAIPQTYAEALLEAGRLALENEKLQAQAIENAPKVVAYDKLMDTHNNISVKEFGKIIGIGEKNLFEWLRNNKYLMSDNNPYQKYMDRGYFEVVEKTCDINKNKSKSYTQTLITPKGQGYLSNKLKTKI